MKKLISAAWTGRSINWDTLSRALLQYRNTPCRKDGLSPAQKLFGHPVQDTLPAHRRSFAPEWQKSAITAERAAHSTQETAKSFYNQHAHSLPDLKVGSHVALQDPRSKLWDIYGVITDVGPYQRYFVRTNGGRTLVRNRRFLRKRSPPSVAGPVSPGPSTPNHIPPGPTTPATVPTGPTTPATVPTGPRRSTRGTRATRPNYLFEDPAWLCSAPVTMPQELGGEV